MKASKRRSWETRFRPEKPFLASCLLSDMAFGISSKVFIADTINISSLRDTYWNNDNQSHIYEISYSAQKAGGKAKLALALSSILKSAKSASDDDTTRYSIATLQLTHAGAVKMKVNHANKCGCGQPAAEVSANRQQQNVRLPGLTRASSAYRTLPFATGRSGPPSRATINRLVDMLAGAFTTMAISKGETRHRPVQASLPPDDGQPIPACTRQGKYGARHQPARHPRALNLDFFAGQ